MPLSNDINSTLQTLENLVQRDMERGLLTQDQCDDMRRKVSLIRSDFVRIEARHDKTSHHYVGVKRER